MSESDRERQTSAISVFEREVWEVLEREHLLECGHWECLFVGLLITLEIDLRPGNGPWKVAMWEVRSRSVKLLFRKVSKSDKCPERVRESERE